LYKIHHVCNLFAYSHIWNVLLQYTQNYFAAFNSRNPSVVKLSKIVSNNGVNSRHCSALSVKRHIWVIKLETVVIVNERLHRVHKNLVLL